MLILHHISTVLPISNQQSNELECINHFLTNLTNFTRQQHFILLLTSTSKQSKLEKRFLETQILNQSISLKIIDQVHSHYDGKSTYIIFITTNEIENVNNLLSKASGFLHIIFEKSYRASEDELKTKIIQIVNDSKNISVDLVLYFHLKFEKKWKLYKTVKNINASNFNIFSIGDCTLSELYIKDKQSDVKLFRVKSPNVKPFAKFSEWNGFYSGIDYRLLQLIAEKLQIPLHFEYLNATAYYDVLQQIYQRNSSESFQLLVESFLQF